MAWRDVVSAVGRGTQRAAEGTINIASIILLFGGLLKFIFVPSDSGLGLILSVIFFILGGYALSEKLETQRLALFIPMLAFFIWYFAFDALYEPVFLFYYILTVVVVLGFFAAFSRGTSIRPSLLGFVPCIFLFLDLGLIPFLVEELRLPITPLMESLILWMPWWSLLGLLTLPQEISRNNFINGMVGLLKIFGIIYIIFIFITPAVPGMGHFSEAGLPVAAELAAAQERLKEKIPQKENPFVSNMYCLFIKGEYQDVQKCVQLRQEEQELKAFCEEQVKSIASPSQRGRAFQNCLKEESEKKKREALQAQGTTDTSIRVPTEAKIIIREENLPKVYVPQVPFPFEVEIANPRQQAIQMDVTCTFSKRLGIDSIAGRVDKGIPTDVISFRDQSYSGQFLCFPLEDLNGSYNFEVELKLLNLHTASRLQRAFVGDIPEEEKERLYREEISRVIREDEALVPAEFAGIHFDLGHAANEIIVENKIIAEPSGIERRYKPILLRANIKNLGSGKLLRVHGYHIDLPGFTPKAGQEACLDGAIDDKAVEAYTTGIPIPVCFIEDMPADLKQPPQDVGWIAQEFVADLYYDYLITAKQSITVKAQ